MLAVLQTNGLRRASNKNVLGLSLLANTLLFYEGSQAAESNCYRKPYGLPTFTIHRGSTWLSFSVCTSPHLSRKPQTKQKSRPQYWALQSPVFLSSAIQHSHCGGFLLQR